MTAHVNVVNTGVRLEGVPTRERYHHGDLRAALVEAGVAAARAGGEGAVRLTALAAGVGVSASAAYRHFPEGLGDLLVAVGHVGRQELGGRIQAAMSEAERGAGDDAERAWLRFRASGQAYVDYAVDEPGLFQVACRHDAPVPEGPDPHTLLEACLDDLVAVGALPSDRRPRASVAAWAAVHGLAVLLTEGALRRLDADERQRAVDRTLDMVGRGL